MNKLSNETMENIAGGLCVLLPNGQCKPLGECFGIATAFEASRNPNLPLVACPF